MFLFSAIPTSLLFPRAFTVGHILDRLGAASLHSTGIIAKPQGHFFLFSPLPCQVRSCVAWFRTSTCVIMRESTSKYSRAHVVEIHVCQPWMLRVSEPLISSCNIQPVLKQTGTCQFARSESGSEWVREKGRYREERKRESGIWRVHAVG